MIKLVLLGFGNVNRHLCNALLKSSYISINQIYTRNFIELEEQHRSIPITNELSEIIHADIYLLAIPDDAIETFTKELPFTNRLIAHTSGAVSIDAIVNTTRKAVLYPIQSFSKESELDYRQIPICIEYAHENDGKLIERLALEISDKVSNISSEKRARLHMAAVFANNFVNHLYHISENILNEDDLDFELLIPLILETAKKIQKLSPSEAQTGPAIRQDLKTIEKHLHLLSNDNNKQLYTILTEAIKEAYGKKL